MIYILLVVFQLKHFIADYPLQTPYMLGKFKEKDWVKPLAFHCAVQAMCTYYITLAFCALTDYSISMNVVAGVTILDFSIHFIMDRIKASPKLLGRYQALSKNEMLEIILNKKNAQIGNPYAEARISSDEKLLKSNTYFWYSLGLDQMVHHLTDILIIYIIMENLVK